ncbi:MAG: galactose-1-phosphate uridylyltransferase [Acholeplasmatales bacterium]|nr:MAG: galactose-1-phosphate uridylyltransferase [Acholeplasmatales bacterium]
MTVNPAQALANLMAYALSVELIHPDDYDYVYNKLCYMLGISTGQAEPIDLCFGRDDLEKLLKPLLDEAGHKGRYDSLSLAARERFAAQIMDVFMPHPSTLQTRFEALHAKHPRLATDDFYHRCVHSRYIRTDQIAANEAFESDSPYGTLKVTINLGKPEKDPRDIIKAATRQVSTYPACLLCKEHVGHDGAPDQPPRANHRIIRMRLGKDPFYLQYSPYAYYAEHAIVLHEKHVPMHIDAQTYERLFDFVDALPHYFIGSNADLPIVGGSMLSHEHYQGGLARFPIEEAKTCASIKQRTVTVERLHWPISTIKISGKARATVIKAADALRRFWQETCDSDHDIIPCTGTTRHNTVTLVVRKTDDMYTVYTMLRNNITTAERPDGRFHVHPCRHGIKKENIGLIEAMGWAILPGRLARDLQLIANYLDDPLQANEDTLAPYRDFIDFVSKQTRPNTHRMTWLKQQVGHVFAQALEDCAVFPQTAAGQRAFQSWMEAYDDNHKI